MSVCFILPVDRKLKAETATITKQDTVMKIKAFQVPPISPALTHTLTHKVFLCIQIDHIQHGDASADLPPLSINRKASIKTVFEKAACATGCLIKAL